MSVSPSNSVRLAALGCWNVSWAVTPEALVATAAERSCSEVRRMSPTRTAMICRSRLRDAAEPLVSTLASKLPEALTHSLMIPSGGLVVSRP